MVDPGQGLLHHYRFYDVPPEGQLVDDPYLSRLFGDEIIRETKTIMNEYEEMVE